MIATRRSMEHPLKPLPAIQGRQRKTINTNIAAPGFNFGRGAPKAIVYISSPSTRATQPSAQVHSARQTRSTGGGGVGVIVPHNSVTL